MSNKIKTNTENNLMERAEQLASHAGVVVMLGATMISMAGVAEREGHRVLAALQPTYAFATEHLNQDGHGEDQLRRGGRDEIRHASETYGEHRRPSYVSGTL